MDPDFQKCNLLDFALTRSKNHTFITQYLRELSSSACCEEEFTLVTAAVAAAVTSADVTSDADELRGNADVCCCFS